MTNKHGDFIWYELLTPDQDAARSFYEKVVGWTIDKAADNEMDYRMINSASGPIAGSMTLTADMQSGGMQPCWLGYITVDNVDEVAEATTAAGGKIHMEPHDLDGVGRIAFLADPSGALFYVMKPVPPADNPDASSNSFAATEPMVGHCAWNELASSDPAAALNFYHDLFGWEKDGEMDMGPMGKYEFLRHDYMIGAVMPRSQELPVSAWTYYFRVPDIDAAADTIKKEGGQIVQPPTEIPGGDYSLTAIDPQGARFALVGAR
jgi:predicted enzyme related to lactoylglutathione lyase